MIPARVKEIGRESPDGTGGQAMADPPVLGQSREDSPKSVPHRDVGQDHRPEVDLEDWRRLDPTHGLPDRDRRQDPEDAGKTLQFHARGRIQVGKEPSQRRQEGSDRPVEPVNTHQQESRYRIHGAEDRGERDVLSVVAHPS